MLVKEYRICMPLSVDEYKIGQLYMIAKHSAEQSHDGEGVEVIENRAHHDPEYGDGQFTEKRIHLASRLPSWVRSFVPRIFYITEKAWNYYPFTITEYTCSFVPRFFISIKTKYENNPGTTENCLSLSDEVLESLEVEHVDILTDEVLPHHYKSCEDLSLFKSEKTHRGPLKQDWKENSDPIMCSYKAVAVRLDIWGIQGRAEEFIHKSIREILLLGHRQAFAWIDDWFDMTIDDVREYEKNMHSETNERLKLDKQLPRSVSLVEPFNSDDVDGDKMANKIDTSGPTTPIAKKGWFSWS